MRTSNRFSFFTSKFGSILKSCHFHFHTSPFACHQNAKRVMTITILLPLTTANFGELIALMCPNAVIHKWRKCSMYFVTIIFEETLRCFHAYHLLADALCFLSSDRFVFRSVYDLFSLNTGWLSKNFFSHWIIESNSNYFDIKCIQSTSCLQVLSAEIKLQLGRFFEKSKNRIH